MNSVMGSIHSNKTELEKTSVWAKVKDDQCKDSSTARYMSPSWS